MSFFAALLFAAESSDLILPAVGVGAVGCGGAACAHATRQSQSVVSQITTAVVAFAQSNPKDTLDAGVKAFELGRDGVKALNEHLNARDAKRAAAVADKTGLPMATSAALLQGRVTVEQLAELGRRR